MSEYIVNVPDEEAEYFIARFGFENVKLTCYSLTGEIVRCKDCKFRCLDECTRIDEGFKDYWFAIELDGFCKWAEREDGGE